MANYKKWDKVDASDNEVEEKEEKELGVPQATWETLKSKQDALDAWLVSKVVALHRAERSKPREEAPQKEPDFDQPPELSEPAAPSKPAKPWRKPTKEERQVLAMLMAASHFEEGQTNLERHPMLLELFRQNRWLEEDPGTLELLVQVQVLGHKSSPNSPEEDKMLSMCLCGINTLAAAKLAGCAGGFLELVNMICTPSSDRARDLRIKWEKKAFAKEAVMTSLFPDLSDAKGDSGTARQSSVFFELWLTLGLLAAALLIIFGVPWLLRPARPEL